MATAGGWPGAISAVASGRMRPSSRCGTGSTSGGRSCAATASWRRASSADGGGACGLLAGRDNLPPLLTGVVVHWRNEDLLAELAAAWPRDPRFELLVVDNGSSAPLPEGVQVL